MRKLLKGVHQSWVYKIESGGVFVYSTERCNIKAEHEEELAEMEEATQFN